MRMFHFALIALLCLIVAPARAGNVDDRNPVFNQPGVGVVVGAPTGGNLGTGTVNATGVYVNGQAVGGGGGSSNIISGGTIDGSLLGSSTPVTIVGERQAVTNVATTAYTTVQSDRFVCVNQTAPATITLLASPGTGTIQTINDCGGGAATFNITVQPTTGTIAGYTNVVMTQAHMSLDFQFTGTGWVLR